MLYLIGGASRSGKSTLALKLLRAKQIPYFSLDLLEQAFRGLQLVPVGTPETAQQAEVMVQRHMRYIIDHALGGHTPYLFEGIQLTPEYLRVILDLHPDRVRGCILGFPHINIDEKLEAVRDYPSESNDWLRSETEALQRDHLTRQKVLSEMMQEQCAQEGVSFIDTGENFNEGVETAFDILTA